MSFRPIATALIALLSACGGGGSDSQVLPAQGPTLPADVPMMSVSLNAPSPETLEANAGPVQVVDTVRWEFDFAPLSFGGPADGIFPAVYELGSDQSVVVSPELAIPGGRGGFGQAMTYGVFAEHAANKRPQLNVVFQQEPNPGPARTDGRYHFVALGRTRVGPVAVAARAALVTGIMALTDGVVNAAGNVSVMVPADLPTSLSGFGDLIVDPQGLRLIGGLSSDGNAIFLAGGGDVGAAQLYALVRESASASEQVLTGAYWIVGLGHGDSWVSSTGTATFDGAGGADVQWESTDGAASDAASFEAAYTVAADGGLSLKLGPPAGAITLRGGVSPDGRVAVAVGGLDANSGNQMIVLVRKD